MYLAKRERLLYKFNIIIIYIILLWSPLTSFFLHIDGRGRLVTLAIILGFIVNIFNNRQWKEFLLSKPIAIWFIWCVFVAINALVKGLELYQMLDGNLRNIFYDQFFFHEIFRQVVVMTIVYYLYLSNKNATIKHIMFIFFTIGVMISLGGSVNMESESGRFQNELGNGGILMMVSFTFFLSFAWVKGILNKTTLLALLTFTFVIILMSQTRKAFGGISIVILFMFLTRVKINKPQTWIILLLLFIICNYSFEYIIDNTGLGKRFVMSEDTNLTNVPWLDFLGDRALHVYLGWFIWLDHPIFGVGLTNAPAYSKLPYVFHQEYIGQLAENGIIGFTLLFYFYWFIGKNLIHRIKQDKSFYQLGIVCLGGFFSILFISLTAWTYSFPHYFVVLAILAAEGNNHFLKNSR